MFGNFIFSDFDETSQNAEIINQKLNDKSNPPSLEDILNTDGVVDELQNKNQKLIEFFTKEKIKQMLDYIIKEPKTDDYNLGHKFPFICSKLFNIEEKNMMEYFFTTNKTFAQRKTNEKNTSQKRNNDMNIEYNEDDIGQYYKISSKENFEDVNFDDEVNMDDVNININEENNNNDNINNINNADDIIENGGIKEDNKDDNEDDNVNYKDENDNIENKEIPQENDNKEINKDDNFNEYDINKGNKEDEDDLVNHNDIEDYDKNLDINDNNKDDIIVNGAIDKNDKEEQKNDNNMIDNDEDDLINIQDEKDRQEKCEENKENSDLVNMNETKDNKGEISNEGKTEEKEELDQVETINENNSEDNIEILDYFLSFLLTDSELNYVLCGYFSSLMTILLNKDYDIIINYLYFKKKDILKKFVYHSYRKSIAETLYKIINYEVKLNDYNIEQQDHDKTDFKNLDEIRIEIIQNIFDGIDINMDTEKYYSMSFLIRDLTENKNIFDCILNSSYIMNIFIKKQLGEFNLTKANDDINIFNTKNNFIIICDIIILWLNKIKEKDLQTPMLLYEAMEDSDEDTVQQKASTKPELHHTLLSQALVDILPDLIKNNFNDNKAQENTIIQSFNDEKLTPLGYHRIKMVELITNITYYFRNVPNELDKLLIQSEFIPNAMNYIFKYGNNNLYQNTLLQFFNAIFNKEVDCPEHEVLYEYIFSELNILETIKLNYPKKAENEGNIGLGFVPFLVSLSYIINTVIGGTPINTENRNYIKQGNITFINRTKNPKLSSYNIPFGIATNNEKEEIVYNISIIPSLKKYCNEEWNYFFGEKISNKINLYEDYLCDMKNTSINKEDDLFYNPVNDNENEELLAFGNKRYYNKDNINKLELEDNSDKFKNMDFIDMEININDYNFGDNIKEEININNNNDIKDVDNEFNSVNYWKNDLEKENNSYMNIIGREAMKDLFEE